MVFPSTSGHVCLTRGVFSFGPFHWRRLPDARVYSFFPFLPHLGFPPYDLFFFQIEDLAAMEAPSFFFAFCLLALLNPESYSIKALSAREVHYVASIRLGQSFFHACFSSPPIGVCRSTSPAAEFLTILDTLLPFPFQTFPFASKADRSVSSLTSVSSTAPKTEVSPSPHFSFSAFFPFWIR